MQTGPNYEKKLNPIIQSAIVQAQKEEVRNLVSTEYVKPGECLKDYDKYSTLVSGQAERDVNSFLSQPYSFQEILAEVIRYQNLAEQIQYSSDEVTCLNIDHCYKVCLNHAKEQMSEVSLLFFPSNIFPSDFILDGMFLILLYFVLEVVQFGMFEVQSRKLVNSLVERTKRLQKKLTAEILQDHEDINKKSVVSFISAAVPKKIIEHIFSSALVGFGTLF